MHFERFRPDPNWQPSGLDMGRRRALVGISGVFVAAMAPNSGASTRHPAGPRLSSCGGRIKFERSHLASKPDSESGLRGTAAT